MFHVGLAVLTPTTVQRLNEFIENAAPSCKNNNITVPLKSSFLCHHNGFCSSISDIAPGTFYSILLLSLGSSNNNNYTSGGENIVFEGGIFEYS